MVRLEVRDHPHANPSCSTPKIKEAISWPKTCVFGEILEEQAADDPRASVDAVMFLGEKLARLDGGGLAVPEVDVDDARRCAPCRDGLAVPDYRPVRQQHGYWLGCEDARRTDPPFRL